jgi:hypothetical protein
VKKLLVVASVLGDRVLKTVTRLMNLEPGCGEPLKTSFNASYVMKNDDGLVYVQHSQLCNDKKGRKKDKKSKTSFIVYSNLTK